MRPAAERTFETPSAMTGSGWISVRIVEVPVTSDPVPGESAPEPRSAMG